MEKSLKIILYIIVGIAIINLLATIFGNSSIRNMRHDLQKARLTTDSALNELKYSKSRLDSIQSDMLIFRSYIGNIQKTVALNDAEKRLREEKDAKKISELKEKIKDLRSDIDTDSLPVVDVLNTK